MYINLLLISYWLLSERQHNHIWYGAKFSRICYRLPILTNYF